MDYEVFIKSQFLEMKKYQILHGLPKMCNNGFKIIVTTLFLPIYVLVLQ